MALSTQEVIHNLALGYVGEYQVEDTTASRALKQNLLCIRYYDQARDEVLKSHLWNEAMVRVIILQDATDPVFGYDRRYSKPSAALRIVSVDDSLGSDQRNKSQGINAWEVEGEYILSNAGETPQTWDSGIEYIDGEFVSITPQAWVTATVYKDGEYVKSGTIVYEVLVNHTSDTVSNDVTSGNLVSRGEGSTVSYEVLVTHTSDTSGTNTAAQQRVDILAGNISAAGDKIDHRIVFTAYVTQLTDITKWGSKLKQAIAMKLAIKIITGLTNDTKGKVDLINEFERLTMPKARSIDGAQGTPKPIFNSEWIRSRQTGTVNVW
ncbi:hypothetical protein LCGC14_0375670 [marine sediment metagenome]|uniref:Uncharacterized protein n=1 Tax=marine sediment metagenome TaxID=412755 RepID=A0A0F9T9K8_9ZZZZ